MRFRCLSLLAVAVLVIAGCSGGGKTAGHGTVLATVNGEAVTLDQLRYRMKFLNLGFPNISSQDQEAGEAGLEALTQLIEETVYLQEAAKAGIAVSGKEVDERLKSALSDYPDGTFNATLKSNHLTMEDFRHDITRKLTIEKLIDSEVYSHVKVEDQELKKYFDGHKGDFSRPGQVRARQIVVEDEAMAHSILEKIRKGADFAAVAKESSLSPDAEAGGDLGYFSKGDMPPEFEDVVFRLKPGQLSPVVQTPYGYHIFKVEDVRPPSNPGFEDVKDQVRQKIAAVKGEDDYMAWQEALKGKAAIDINTGALGKI
ncbi:MAG TPA: peptidyl-prolyl cis-trans isomerase [Nitrospirota bacterium]|jgi:peptidyl-prolyl cis-trans isomerase C